MPNNPQRFSLSSHTLSGKFSAAVISAALLFCFLTIVVTAQSASDALQGRVADVNGAALPGASVTLHNLNTGLERSGVTSADGSFAFPGVRDGRFRTAPITGFAATSVVVELPRREAITLQLEPAALAERITVISGSRQEELRESLNTKVDVIGRTTAALSH